MKVAIAELEDDGDRILRARRKSKSQLSRNILSKRIKSDSALAGNNSRSSAPRENDRRDETAAENESLAMGAAMQCCPEILQLTHPWPRYRNIFGGDEGAILSAIHRHSFFEGNV